MNFIGNTVCAKPQISYKIVDQTSDRVEIAGTAKSLYKTPVSNSYYEIYWSETANGKQQKIESSSGLNCKIEIDNNKFKKGHYYIKLFATNKYGKTQTETIHVELFNNPEFVDNIYRIVREDEGVLSTNVPRDQQSITFKVEDKDLNDNITVVYRVDEYDYDLEKLGYNNTGGFSAFFANPYLPTIKNVKSGDTVTIDIPASEKDNNTMKYVYIALKDKYGSQCTVMKTGALCFSSGPLQLKTVENASQITKTDIGLNDEFKVKLTFNFDINQAEDKLPNLHMIFGGYDKIQNRIETDEKFKNEITYVYKIDENCKSGDIEIGRYDGQFEAKSSAEKTYSIQIGEDTYEDFVDEITGKYKVDTVRPSIESIKVNIQAQDSDISTIGNTKYISNIEAANITLQYSEEVYGKTGSIILNKGNKAEIVIPLDSTDVRKDEIVYIKNDIMDQSEEYEGFLKLRNINYVPVPQIATKDKAGNYINTQNNYNVEYYLNDTLIENPENVIFDSTIYEPRLFIEEKEVKGNGTYKTGTTFTGFAEFKEALNFEDESGLKEIKMEVDYNNEVVILDKNNQEITSTIVENSEKAGYNKASFTLTESQLPLAFTLDDAGEYDIKMSKEDNSGNKIEKEYSLGIKDEISIKKEDSKLVIIEENGTKTEIVEPTNIKKVQGKIKYNFRLQLIDMTSDDIKVNLARKTKNTTEYVDLGQPILTSTEGEIIYADYQFDVDRGGEYNISVTKLNSGEEFSVQDINDPTKTFKETIVIDNLFIPGDMDNDGRVCTVNDLSTLLKYLAYKLTETPQLKYASNIYGGEDENGNLVDEGGDVMDAVAMARIVAEDKMTINSHGYIVDK